jgi:hypothetical protein
MVSLGSTQLRYRESFMVVTRNHALYFICYSKERKMKMKIKMREGGREERKRK